MYLIGNGKLFNRYVANPYIECGGIVVEDNLIKETGDFADLKNKYPDAEVIDAKNQIIMPAFINVHNHIYSSLARGLMRRFDHLSLEKLKCCLVHLALHLENFRMNFLRS